MLIQFGALLLLLVPLASLSLTYSDLVPACLIGTRTRNFLAQSMELNVSFSSNLLIMLFCFSLKIASMPHIVDILANWDIQETEKLISKNEAKKNERLKIEKDYRDKQTKL